MTIFFFNFILSESSAIINHMERQLLTFVLLLCCFTQNKAQASVAQVIIISKTVHRFDFRCSEITWPNRHCTEKERIEHSSTRLFNVRKYENLRK